MSTGFEFRIIDQEKFDFLRPMLERREHFPVSAALQTELKAALDDVRRGLPAGMESWRRDHYASALDAVLQAASDRSDWIGALERADPIAALIHVRCVMDFIATSRAWPMDGQSAASRDVSVAVLGDSDGGLYGALMNASPWFAEQMLDWSSALSGAEWSIMTWSDEKLADFDARLVEVASSPWLSNVPDVDDPVQAKKTLERLQQVVRRAKSRPSTALSIETHL